MNSDPSTTPRLIWATRGRHWGFRFLLDAGFDDPLPTYRDAFAGIAETATALRHHASVVALRFADPEGRRDSARRVIPHEFVIFGDLANSVDSIDDGVRVVWPLVAGVYSRVWEAVSPPSLGDAESPA